MKNRQIVRYLHIRNLNKNETQFKTLINRFITHTFEGLG